MLPYLLLPLLVATPLFANVQANLEKTAALDAEQTFRETEKTAAELLAKDLDSPTELRILRSPIEDSLKEYCASMKRFPRLQKSCELLKKSIASFFDQREEALKKNGKPDKFTEALDQIDAFQFRYYKLRGTQEDGKNLDPDILHRERNKLVKEMQAFCPAFPHPEIAKSCLANAKRFDHSLAEHEENIRKGAFDDPPPSKKVYRDTTPVLRCFFRLPKISAADYKVSDPSGRYRFEHLVKTEFGYALSLNLSELTRRKVNDSKNIQKKFTNPSSGKTYDLQLTTQYACAPGHSPETNCRADAISIHLSHSEGSETKGQARAAFPIKVDSTFDFSLPLDEDEIEEYSLSCAIASKIRKDGWVFSDEFFEEN